MKASIAPCVKRGKCTHVRIVGVRNKEYSVHRASSLVWIQRTANTAPTPGAQEGRGVPATRNVTLVNICSLNHLPIILNFIINFQPNLTCYQCPET